MEIKRLLERISIQVISVITAGSYVEQIKNAANVALNIVTHDDYGTPVAEYMRDKFDIPFIGSDSPSPYGLQQTTNWLNSIALHFGLNVENVIDEEKRFVEDHLLPKLRQLVYRHRLKGIAFAIFADSPLCLSVSSFLEEYLGLEPVLLGLKTVGENTESLANELLAKSYYRPQILKEPDGMEIQEALHLTKPELLLGSSFERFIAHSVGLSPEFVGISYPVADEVILTDNPFAGYRGVLTLAEKVINAVCFKGPNK
jgi:nitrogenase molybdenum-iron protein alpha/beta subunit